MGNIYEEANEEFEAHKRMREKMTPEIGVYYWVKLEGKWEIAKAVQFRKKLTFSFTEGIIMTFKKGIIWHPQPVIK